MLQPRRMREVGRPLVEGFREPEQTWSWEPYSAQTPGSSTPVPTPSLKLPVTSAR